MLRASTIEEVIRLMDDIVHDCLIKESRLGYFAALYRATTIVVKEHCDRGDFFEDNDRMRYLDVVFANFYFEALGNYLAQTSTVSRSWFVSFELAERADLVILQHLLLGMNAHISLDLGIATAEIANGDLNESLERDFYRLNNLLAGMIDSVQAEIAEVSPLLRWMDRLAWRSDEYAISQGIARARDWSWNFAKTLTALPRDQWQQAIQQRDQQVADISTGLGYTRWYLRPILKILHALEHQDARTVTEALSNEQWQRAVTSRLDTMLEQAQMQGLDLSKRDTQIMRIPNILRNQ